MRNHWNETSEIAARLAGLLVAGRRAALATVVAVEGSAYRRPGAKFLVDDRGETLGSVSGGCLEADVREVAAAAIATGQSSWRRYDTGSSTGEVAWGLGMGCDGRVDVYVQPATAGVLPDLLPRLAARLAGDHPFTLLTELGEAPGRGDAPAGGLLLVDDEGTHGALAGGGLDRAVVRRLAESDLSAVHHVAGRTLFCEPMTPPEQLLVCGAGDDSIPRRGRRRHRLARPGGRSPAGPRDARALPAGAPALRRRSGRFRPRRAVRGEALAVVKMHDYDRDRAWVRRLLAAGAPFVGLLGPRARGARIREEIGAAESALHSPVGLVPGAEGAHQIAISVVAQLLDFLRRREARTVPVAVATVDGS
ncbi:MAG: XdhC family protein [Thermoanaerobaculia bacterium]